MNVLFEKTCKCFKSKQFIENGTELNFLEGHEYQIDIYPLFNKVYVNGGWDNYVYLTDEELSENFKIIE